MTIPIANLFYLLLYAWNCLDEAEVLDVDAEEQTELADLFARVLTSGTNDLLRRGIDRGYVPHRETIVGLRGKLLMSESIGRNLFQNGRAHCAFDELNTDVLHNQVLKATFASLLRSGLIDRAIREQARDTYRRLSGVSDIRLSSRHFGMVQLHRNVMGYRLLMNVCRFIFDNLLVDERSGQASFRDFVRDEHQMRTLFESFALNFFRHHFPQLRVWAPQIEWAGADRSDPAFATLPLMHTDITVEWRGKVLIIDTKFTPKAFERRYENDRARSNHLYQLFSYVKNYAAAHPAVQVRGMLLYPVVEAPFEATYRLEGNTLMIRSVDLRQNWRAIDQAMTSLIAAEQNAELMTAAGAHGSVRQPRRSG